MSEWNHMQGWWGGAGWHMVWFWLPLVVIIVALILLATRYQGRDGSGGRSALDILKERYAKGEIDRDEFQTKKRDLGG
jgi:putative membrane protein